MPCSLKSTTTAARFTNLCTTLLRVITVSLWTVSIVRVDLSMQAWHVATARMPKMRNCSLNAVTVIGARSYLPFLSTSVNWSMTSVMWLCPIPCSRNPTCCTISLWTNRQELHWLSKTESMSATRISTWAKVKSRYWVSARRVCWRTTGHASTTSVSTIMVTAMPTGRMVSWMALTVCQPTVRLRW